MRNLVQRVDIVKINLPQPEGIDGRWMQIWEANAGLAEAEEEVIIVIK